MAVPWWEADGEAFKRATMERLEAILGDSMLKKKKEKMPEPKFPFSQLCYKNATELYPDAGAAQLRDNRLCYERVSSLVHQTHFDIDHWDWQAMFQNPEYKAIHLITDSATIGRIFFERYDKEKADWELQVGVAAKAVEEKILEKFGDDCDADRSISMEAEKRAYIQQINERLEEIEYRNRIIQGIEQARAKAQGKNWSMVEAVGRAIREVPFFKFESVHQAQIRFLTPPITLFEKNPAAGIDLKVDMGSFRVDLDPYGLEFRVWQHMGNTIYNDYYHPHVSHRGTICYGDEHATILQELSAGDLVRGFRTLQGILTQYNPGGPYVSLHTFHVAKTDPASLQPRERRCTRDLRAILTFLRHNPYIQENVDRLSYLFRSEPFTDAELRFYNECMDYIGSEHNLEPHPGEIPPRRVHEPLPTPEESAQPTPSTQDAISVLQEVYDTAGMRQMVYRGLSATSFWSGSASNNAGQIVHYSGQAPESLPANDEDHADDAVSYAIGITTAATPQQTENNDNG